MRLLNFNDFRLPEIVVAQASIHAFICASRVASLILWLAVCLRRSLLCSDEHRLTLAQAAMDAVNSTSVRPLARAAVLAAKTTLALAHSLYAHTTSRAICWANVLLALLATKALVANTAPILIVAMPAASEAFAAITRVAIVARACALAFNSKAIGTAVNVAAVTPHKTSLASACLVLGHAPPMSFFLVTVVDAWCT